MIEWEHLALFCQSDPDFFARPDRIADTAERLAHREPPEHWERTEKDLWVRLRPAYRPLKRTGWKIHVAVTPGDADHACAIVWDYCVERDIPFKFLRSRRAVQLLNGKYADRSASGKTITIYPADDEELAEALETLGRLLKGITGPYVLSDLRIGEGPLFVRYGAFTKLTCVGEDGEPVSGRLDPDGRIVPDVREARFVLPERVKVPEVLTPHLEARHGGSADFPFAVESVMHYSNAGGVYLATRKGTDERVVLVEARPHAGLDRNGRDAVARLQVQRDILRRLDGLPCVPRLLGHHLAWEHHFLVEEHVEGLSLFDEMVRRYPYAHNTYGPPEPEVRAYTEWAAEIVGKIGHALERIHERGVRYGDLHPGNVIVRPDGEIVLVDYEYARDLDDTTILDGGAPGFHAPAGVSGAAADRYQLECVRVWLHLPMNMRPEHTPAQVRRAIGTVTDLFPVDETFAAQTAAGFGLTGDGPAPDVADRLLGDGEISWPAVRDSLVAGIMESADFSRDGALFPGGPQQFATGGFTLAYGAAGVLLALHRVGAEVPASFADWMAAQALRSPDAKPGLYDGLHGVAYVLDELGYTDVALKALEQARAAEDRVATAGLLSGGAGHALNLLHFAHRTGDDTHLAGALAIGERLAGLTDDRKPAEGGLIRGMSGVALCFLRLFETTGGDVWLDRARAALQQDLDRGEVLGGDTFHLVDHGTRRRNILYVEGGSAGLAIVAHEYLRHRQDEALAAAVTGVRRGCRAPFTRGPSLFRGRAGFIATLAHLGHPGDHDVLMAHVPRLALHAQPYRGHLAFPSTKLLRLSMDVASGSAGILLALNSAFRGGRSFLPFLGTGTTEGR
ncbi:class III lanthionine synthetase LanKC [Nonomuraea sp. NPDC050547]|uniref:class III lanthionine synthetase LanKC n=1 Tax=Nonomuraea sp. NPDC050547 TaxID=3364368 RepID=UPI0037AD313E